MALRRLPTPLKPPCSSGITVQVLGPFGGYTHMFLCCCKRQGHQTCHRIEAPLTWVAPTGLRITVTKSIEWEETA